MRKLLLINANVNRKTSRTNRLSRELIKLLIAKEGYDSITELILEEENIQALNSEGLGKRSALSEKGEFDNEMFKYAHQFTEANCVVIAAPYWEFAYPAMLKNWIEAISVVGITYRYGEDGRSVGLCNTDKIYYVTTSGGFIKEYNFGYDTIKALAMLYGVKDTICITAEGLDIQTNDAEAILNATIANLQNTI